MALPTISSTTSLSVRRRTSEPVNLVSDRMFSVTRISQRASLLISRSRSCRVSSPSSFSSSVELAPRIEASGVRRSCETERSRFARIFSASTSYRNRSCRLICVVSVLMMIDTTSITVKVSG